VRVIRDFTAFILTITSLLLLQHTGVGKSRFTVVSTRNTEFILVLLLLLLFICIICLLLCFLLLIIIIIIIVIYKAIVIVITCMSFSIRTNVNLLLHTPV